MMTTILCVLCALAGAALATVWSRGKHPAAVFIGLVVGALFGLAPLALTEKFVLDMASQPGLFARIGIYLHGIRTGDPVIWGGTVAFLLFAVILLAVWAKTAHEFQREEEQSRRRRGG